ncbi:hypothetical protein JTB14_013449 [Gonioctena quinquepunctata]|nr:hypothetical protein JTB14_013449 [Gonioctena quinquepunctata]
MKHVNSSLVTLKCVLFLVFGAIGSLFPFLPLPHDFPRTIERRVDPHIDNIPRSGPDRSPCGSPVGG